MANGQLTWGDVTVDYGSLPPASQHALAQYGLSHYLGNVQASKMVARIRGKDGLNDAEGDVSSFRKAHADVVSAWAQEHLDAALKDLQAGTVGSHRGGGGGPRKDPVESKFMSLVVADIRARLKGNGSLLKQFNKAKGSDTIDFGGGVSRTREQMITSTVTAKGDTLRKEAEKMVRDEARLAERAGKAVENAEATPEALGF